MKRILSLTAALLLASAMTGLTAFAADDDVTVNVTISDDKGQLVLVQEPVTVTDTDGDGTLTINDALYLAHEAAYDGGAAAGYASAQTDYGLSLQKLWGVENGGSYGYYRNHGSTLSLSDAVADGDTVQAFVYTDLTAWSDTYSYFDQESLETAQGSEFTLTLMQLGFDESWNLSASPVSGAVITIDGERSEFVTDADGKVTLSIADAGKKVVSAVSDTMTLVPPVSVVQVAEGETPTEETTAPSETTSAVAETTATQTTAAPTTTAATTAMTTTPHSGVTTAAKAAQTTSAAPSTASANTGETPTAGIIALVGISALGTLALCRKRK